MREASSVVTSLTTALIPVDPEASCHTDKGTECSLDEQISFSGIIVDGGKWVGKREEESTYMALVLALGSWSF